MTHPIDDESSHTPRSRAANQTFRLNLFIFRAFRAPEKFEKVKIHNKICHHRDDTVITHANRIKPRILDQDTPSCHHSDDTIR